MELISFFHEYKSYILAAGFFIGASILYFISTRKSKEMIELEQEYQTIVQAGNKNVKAQLQVDE